MMTTEEAIRDLHRPFEDDVIEWDCYNANCEHDPMEECPTVKQTFCQECAHIAMDGVSDESYPAVSVYPCATIKVLDAVTTSTISEVPE